MGRVAIGRTFARSSLFGNLRFERPLTTGRDAADLVTTVGWMRRVGPALNVGVEAVGEDLEGLWEADEAEGGAKLFAGPSLHFARPQAVDNGYTVRMSFGYSF